MGSDFSLLDHVSVYFLLGTICLAGLSSFLLKLYRARSTMLKLRRQGLVRVPKKEVRTSKYLAYQLKANAPLQPDHGSSALLCQHGF